VTSGSEPHTLTTSDEAQSSSSMAASTAPVRIEPRLSTTCPSLMTGSLSLCSVTEACSTYTAQMIVSSQVEQTASDSRTVCSVTQMSRNGRDISSAESLQDVTVNAASLASGANSQILSERTSTSVNASRTVPVTTESDICAILTRREQADAGTVAVGDSVIQATSFGHLGGSEVTTSAGEVSASAVTVATCSNKPEIAVSDTKMTVELDSSQSECLARGTSADVADGSGEAAEDTVRGSHMTLSRNRDSESGKADGSQEMLTTEAKETASQDDNDDSDRRAESQHEVAVAPRDVDKDTDAANGSEDGEKMQGSLKEQQLRQFLTLPFDLLTHINPSLPVCLSVKHDHRQITVPADNIYRSTSGLRLLLPADSLPAEYVGSKQLACTLGRDAVGQSQLISVSLSLH